MQPEAQTTTRIFLAVSAGALEINLANIIQGAISVLVLTSPFTFIQYIVLYIVLTLVDWMNRLRDS